MTPSTGSEPGRGLRLEVPITFSPEPLDDIDASAAIIAEPVRKHRTTHWDTADLRLARWGVALEYSAETGWVLRLPATSEGMASPDGAELHFDGGPEHPPEQVLHLVRVYARHAPVELVARLVTVTGETVLLDAAGAVSPAPSTTPSRCTRARASRSAFARSTSSATASRCSR